MSVIKRLTPGQKERIPVYHQKWRKIASNSVGANRSRVQAALLILYRAIDLPSPKVQFFRGPAPFYQAFESYRFRLAPNTLEDYERAIRRAAMSVLMSVILATMLCWVWSVFLLLAQLPGGFLGVILVSLLWIYSPRKPVVKSLSKLAPTSTFIGLGFLAWFLLSPLVCAWVVRNNITLAWVLVSLPIASVLLNWLIAGLKRRLPQSRWKQMIEVSIRHQLSRKVRQQLHQVWAVDSLLPEPSPRASPRGYFSSQKWSYAQFPKQPSDCLDTLDWLEWCSYIDFCVSELGCSCNRPLWDAIQAVIEECGLVLPLQRFCWVCDRPNRIALDAQGRLHGEGEAAIAFGDDSCIYVYQGVTLPPQYGKLHPRQWRAEWVLTEQNAEVRRVLIQGIGYGRLCQELGARTLDTWREYTLLQLDLPTRLRVNVQEVEEESVLLLKMVCPSTQHIHVLRVPPHMRSARAAAKWVNWGTDPNDFFIEA